MRTIQLVALLLIVLGTVVLAYPALHYTTRDTIIDVGSVHVTAEHEHPIPLRPFAGGAAVVVGVGLLITKRRA